LAVFVFVALDLGSGVDVEEAPTGIVVPLEFFVDEVETIEIVIRVPSVTSRTAVMAIAPVRNRPCFTVTFLGWAGSLGTTRLLSNRFGWDPDYLIARGGRTVPVIPVIPVMSP